MLEGNRGNVRVAGRPANGIRSTGQRQSAAIVFPFSFFVFHVHFVVFVGAACQCLWMVGHDCFHELIYHLRTPAGQTGPQSTLRSRNSAC